VYQEHRLASQALPLLERALSIREQQLGLHHPDTGRTLVDLASTLMQLGDRQRSQSLAKRALLVWERLNLPNAPEYATVLALFADIQYQAGRYAVAREYFEKALSIRGKAFGMSSPLFAEAEEGMGLALAGQGERSAALRAAVHVETVGREHLQLMLRSLPERQALNYATARPRGLTLMLSLSAAMPDAVPLALDALVRSRALVLDEIAARQRAAHLRQGSIDPTQAAWKSAQQRLANLLARGPGPMSATQYARAVEDASRDRERTEEALAERNPDFRDERARDRIGLEQVSAALPPDSVLLSFARNDQGLRGAAPTYVVFVTRNNRVPVVVSLGSVRAIDAQVLRWRADIAAQALASETEAPARSAASRASGEALRRLVWDPVSPHMSAARRVFVVPDGTLSLVSLAALPIGPSGYVLEENRVIHYLSTERDLVPGSPARAATGGLLAIGGPSFDDATLLGPAALLAMESGPTTSSMRLRAGTQTCNGFQTIAFEPLPGTLQEVEDVSGLWSTRGSPTVAPPRVLVGARATETAFKEEAPRYSVLHLATHGFFIADGCPTLGAKTTRGVGGLSGFASSTLTENPLLLSGLALAGANRRASARPDQDEGILTAEEVVSLDLGGVEWAVLSACDTGVGEVSAGEGVFGLRRAFQVAGAHTVIMSLWSVGDEAARAWMHELYLGRFQKGLSTADAVHNASLTVLRDRRARGLSTQPFYWAGFVAAGDWK
jgi:CHAT domain-containing protein/tetratricopeptide (TPR) repeat protein